MSKCKITGKVLVVQFGREETQFVLMGSGAEILHIVSALTPQGAVEDGMIQNAEAICGMMKAVLRDQAFKHVRQAVFSLCTSQVITEIVTTPDLPAAKLERLLQANVDMYFPVEMKDYQMVWQPIGPKTNESGLKELSVQLWAVPRAMLIPYYGVANACGLSVAAIDYCGNSLAGAVGASFAAPVKAGKQKKKLSLNTEISFGKKKEEPIVPPEFTDAASRTAQETDVHILLEKDLLGMTFVQNGQVVYQRFIRCGADPSYQFTELSMMLEYFRSMEMGWGSQMTACFYGALADNDAITNELTDLLDIPVRPYNAPFGPSCALCVGAYRTTQDFGSPDLNRPGKARRQVTSQLWQYGLVLASGIVLTASIMLVLTSRLNWSAKEKSLQSTMQNWTIQAQQVAGYADNYNAYSSLYDSYSADWDTIFSSLQTYNDNLVRVLQELEEILPENTSVVQLQINADGINVEFACEDKEEAAYLIMSLRELQYADLAGISNLSGGGNGAANSFGTQGSDTLPVGSKPATGNTADESSEAEEDSEVEAPPTVGSGNITGENFSAVLQLPATFTVTAKDTTQTVTVTDLVKSELTEDELMDLALGMTPEQFTVLEGAYGKRPTNINTSLAVLKLAQSGNDILQERKDAIDEMMSTNPFVMNRFLDLLEDDFYREARYDQAPILWPVIMSDLVKEGVMNNGTPDEIDELKESLDTLVRILTKNEETVAATEALICASPSVDTEKVVEKWYVYYLEVELGQQTAEQFPYLDMNKVIDDMMDGHFNTSDADLNAKLDALISQETWDLITKLGSDAEMEVMMNAYLTTGTTGDERVDAIIESYLNNGTTGVDAVDERIEAYIASGKLDGAMEDLMNKYFDEGTTGNDKLDDMIESYLATGTTGSEVMDDYINEYIESEAFSTKVNELLDAYAKNQTTGHEALDDMIEDMIMKYMRDGTTGNTKIDALIKEYLDNLFGPGDESSKPNDESSKPGDESSKPGDENSGSTVPGYTDEQIEELLMKYLTTGSTGVEYFDNVIKKYLETGTTGSDKLDDIVEDYIEKKAEEFTKEQVAEMMNNYLTKGTTGNEAYDELIQKFIKNGTTGNEKLDQMIKDFVSDYMTNSSNGSDSLMNAIDSIFGGGTGTGAAGEQVDTRIHFVASLGYNDELKNAELTRKGLDYGEKVNKVEVTE